MRIFTLLAATAMAMTAYGASPMLPMLKSHHMAVAPRSDEDFEDAIYDTPEGEYSLMQRECEGWTTEAFEAKHRRLMGSTVEMVVADDGTVWLNHIISEYPVGTWIDATRSGNKLTISGAKLVCYEYSEEIDDNIGIYAVPMKKMIDPNTQSGTYVATDDMLYTFDIAADGTLTSSDPELLLGLAVKNPDNPDQWVWKGFGDYNISISPVTAKPVELPEGLECEEWVWKGPYDIGFVKVAVDGNDIYVSGMDRDIPDAWVKGTITDGKAMFLSGQYMGPDFEMFFLHYFCGAEVEQIYNPDTGNYDEYGSMTDQAVFTYDAENKVLALEGYYMMNADASRLFPLISYDSVEVKKQNRNVDAAPSAPYDLVYNFSYGEGSLWFQIDATDVDGNLLRTDRLFYEILLDDEALEFAFYDENDEEYQSSLLPYAYQDWMDIYVEGADHTVYFYTEPKKSVVIRSKYVNENNELLTSEPYILDMTSVADIDIDHEIAKVEWFDLQGRRMARPAKGIAIRVTTYTDGTTSRSKIAL